MRILMAVAASLMLMLALVGPVTATGPGCSDFGAGAASFAQAGGFGKLVSSVARRELAPFGYVGVSALVHAEHEGLAFAWPCAKYAP